MRQLLFCLFMLSLCMPLSSEAEDYQIGQGDILEVAVWGVPEMSRSVIVRPDGKITLPAVGDIVADGNTPAALGESLATAMKEYIKQPVVTVSVQEIRNNRVYVTGGSLSRVVDMTRQMTLLKLLSQLGDLSGVDLRRAYLSRAGKEIPIDFFALYFEGDLTQDVELKAEDIIFLPSNTTNIIYVLGAVGSPQPLQYVEGMRVLDAILGAGGFTEFAKENAVTIIKQDKTRLSVDLKKVKKGKDIDDNVKLSPGDYVVVEESLF